MVVGPTIRFKHGRLLVGWRRRDWKAVWFEPGDPSEIDDDGARHARASDEGPTKRKFVFSTDDRKSVWAAPIRGEISWEPHFDPAECEATTYKDKMMLQKEYLSKAHDYMSEQNPETVRQMEQELDDPDFARWQSWFNAAKKEKHRRLRTRKRRTKRFQADGVPDEEIRDQVRSDISDHEDDCESDHDSTYEGFGAIGESMPPPSLSSMSGRKRKGDKRGRNGNGPDKRRARADTEDEDDPRFHMTGARGRSSHDSPMMDTRPPPPMNTPPSSGRPAVRRQMSPYAARVDDADGDDAEDIFVDRNGGKPSNERWHNADEYNGGGVDEDEATRQAIRQSMPPETRASDRPVQSIERDDDDEEGIGEEAKEES